MIGLIKMLGNSSRNQKLLLMMSNLSWSGLLQMKKWFILFRINCHLYLYILFWSLPISWFLLSYQFQGLINFLVNENGFSIDRVTKACYDCNIVVSKHCSWVYMLLTSNLVYSGNRKNKGIQKQGFTGPVIALKIWNELEILSLLSRGLLFSFLNRLESFFKPVANTSVPIKRKVLFRLHFSLVS